MKRDPAVFVVLLILTYVLGALWQIPLPRNNEQNAGTDRQKNDAAFTAINPITAVAEAPQSDDISKNIKKEFLSPLFWVQAALVGVGIYGICIGLNTLRQIRRQTWANIRSANAAKKTADFISLTDRAFLNIVEWRLVPQKPKPMAFQAQLVNSGKIPAIVTKHIVRSVCAKGLPDEPDYSVAEEIKPIRVPVSPGYPEHVMAELKELDRTIDTMAVDQERKSIFVWGLIEYHDALGERVLRYGGRHITQREYGSLIQPVKINEFFNRSDVPPKYNYAD